MIYLQNTSEKQQIVTVPTTGAIEGAYTFSLFSTVDRREVYRALRYGEGKRLRVCVNVTLPKNLSDGEYEYQITVKKVVTDCGVAVLGQYETEKQYQESIEYKQYGE